MSNRDPEVSYDELPQALRFFGDWLMRGVNTALPGIVDSYDPATRRAQVRPALDLMLTDGRSLQRPPIADVPVLAPAGGGFLVHIPLQRGDPVLLIWCSRDISGFKETLEAGELPSPDVMGDSDVIALPGSPGPPPPWPATGSRSRPRMGR